MRGRLAKQAACHAGHWRPLEGLDHRQREPGCQRRALSKAGAESSVFRGLDSGAELVTGDSDLRGFSGPLVHHESRGWED